MTGGGCWTAGSGRLASTSMGIFTGSRGGAGGTSTATPEGMLLPAGCCSAMRRARRTASSTSSTDIRWKPRCRLWAASDPRGRWR
jgi:hypothetical protein